MAESYNRLSDDKTQDQEHTITRSLFDTITGFLNSNSNINGPGVVDDSDQSTTSYWSARWWNVNKSRGINANRGGEGLESKGIGAIRLETIPIPLAVALSTILVSLYLWRRPNLRVHKQSGKPNARKGKKSRPKMSGEIKVSKILIHPIKSCRGTSVPSAKYTPQGLENDRKWAIIDAETKRIITAREVFKMVLITPRIELDETSPYGGQLNVSFPEDSGCKSFSIPLHPDDACLKSWPILPEITIWPTHAPVDGYICQSLSDSPTAPSDILTNYFGKPVHLVYKGPRRRAIDPTTEFPELDASAFYQDMYPLLIMSQENMEVIQEKLKPKVGSQGIEEGWRDGKVVIERFRPNIVVTGGGPFAEDEWEEISIGPEGAPKITLVSKCTRCLLPNVSPETGERDKAVPFKVIMGFRTGIHPEQKSKPCVGCNAVPDADGVVSVGDVVRVEKMNQ